MEANFWQVYGPEGLRIVGIAASPLPEDASSVRAFVDQTGATFPVVLDDGSFARFAWPAGPAPYPRQALIAGDGTVALVQSTHDPARLRDAIETLLPATIPE